MTKFEPLSHVTGPNLRYKHLLAPLVVKQMRLRNRIVKSSTVLGFAEADGSAGSTLIDHYEALARGGAGLLVAESSCVDFPLGGKGENRLRIDDDRYIDSFARLADAIHQHGASTVLQLTHNGPAGKFSGQQPIAASALSADQVPLSDPRVKYDPAREMTLADIERAIEKHADAAGRAQQAGFDGVEVHAGHSYLINSFLSRAWNRRTDAYGCLDLDSRARFAVEIIRAIRSRVGANFIVGMRVNGEEWGHEAGITPEECSEFARRFEATGLDLLHVTGWGYGDGAYSWVQYPEQLLYPEPSVSLAALVRKPGAIASRAAIVKQAVDIPVIAVGSIGRDLGEWLLREGKVDLIAMGRALMADPDLPLKLTEGRAEDIRPCMSCLECRTPFQRYRPTACRVNAALGKEREYQIRPATQSKRVVVVGGGPSGMEAARVAASRGHQVTLFERGSTLGGSLPLASLIKGTQIENFPALVKYFERQLKNLGVELELNCEFNIELAEDLQPDVVVIAVGGQPARPDIPGIENPKVLAAADLQSKVQPYLRLFGPKVLGWLSRLWLPIGRRVVVIGGKLHGCQLSSFLVKRGRSVVIVEESDEAGTGVPVAMKQRLLDWLRERGTVIMTGARCTAITTKGVTVERAGGDLRFFPADNVITALAPLPNLVLGDALRARVKEVYCIGDCGDSTLILQAIGDGARIGHAI